MAPKRATSLLTPRRLWLIFASSSLFLFHSICALPKNDPHSHRTHHGFKTEPDFFPQRFSNVFKTHEESLLSPGYIFIALMQSDLDAWGPQIYDLDGQVVWYGRPQVDEYRIADFHVCDYNGAKGTHLCWHERKPNPDPHRKHPFLEKVILDNTYGLVHNFSTDGNGHETNMVDDGMGIVTMYYLKKQWDLSPYCGRKHGCIHDPCTLEYDAKTGEELFRWCLIDHFPVHESKVYFNEARGCGINQTTQKAGRGTCAHPWDLAHMNAADKNRDGNYIGSYRHFDAIISVAGPNSTSGAKPGEVLWVLGGQSNQFEKSFNFSRQHMVRYLDRPQYQSKHKTVISLFNNAWEGALKPAAERSSGQIIEVDTDKMTARLLKEYPHPKGKLSASRGSMQVLPNDNAFIGWGATPEMTEFSPNGTILYHAEYASPSLSQFSYRVFKAPWIGKPPWPPKLVAYSYRCDGSTPLYAYVSWNGQTEVHQWQFHTAITLHGPWLYAGTFSRTGFETMVELNNSTLLDNSMALFVSVTGLDAHGEILGTATEAKFVPHRDVRNQCDIQGCHSGFIYNGQASNRQKCDVWYTPLVLLLIILLLFLEGSVASFGCLIIQPSEFEYDIRPRFMT